MFLELPELKLGQLHKGIYPLIATFLSFEAGDPDDHCSQMSEESTDQNLPHDSDLDEDELLGTVTDFSVPGGHSDDSIALTVCPGEDDL